jgi:hypothetical protein
MNSALVSRGRCSIKSVNNKRSSSTSMGFELRSSRISPETVSINVSGDGGRVDRRGCGRFDRQLRFFMRLDHHKDDQQHEQYVDKRRHVDDGRRGHGARTSLEDGQGTSPRFRVRRSGVVLLLDLTPRMSNGFQVA